MGSVIKLGEDSDSYSSERWDHKGWSVIVQINISYGEDSIRSLQFHYLAANGTLHSAAVLGCQNFSGAVFDTITFQGKGEYVTKVEGTRSCSTIEKLTIHTNKKVYEIFKAQSPSSHKYGKPWFSFNCGGENQFGGFHGTQSSRAVTSIGVYFNRLTTPPTGYLTTPKSAAFNFARNQ